MKIGRPLITMVILLTAAALLCCGTGLLRNAQAEQQETGEKIFERFMKAETEKQTEDSAQSAKKSDTTANYMPDFSPIVLENEQTKAAMYNAFKSYYDYRARGFEHRRQVFDWQLLSAKIIFCVVIFLVLTGVYFSWVQFHKKMDGMKAGQEGHDGTPEINDDITTLSASAKEIKISSPVLGVIILIISLLFFYLYLIYVFPIEEIL